MTMDELDARLATIERVLTVLLAQPQHSSAIEEMKRDLYNDVGQQLNRMFPSDPGYQALRRELDGFNDVANAALAMIDVAAD